MGVETSFKSNVCHWLKEEGDIDFLIQVLESDLIKKARFSQLLEWSVRQQSLMLFFLSAFADIVLIGYL